MTWFSRFHLARFFSSFLDLIDFSVRVISMQRFNRRVTIDGNFRLFPFKAVLIKFESQVLSSQIVLFEQDCVSLHSAGTDLLLMFCTVPGIVVFMKDIITFLEVELSHICDPSFEAMTLIFKSNAHELLILGTYRHPATVLLPSTYNKLFFG